MFASADCHAHHQTHAAPPENNRLGDPSFPIVVSYLEQCQDAVPVARLNLDLADPCIAASAALLPCNVILVHGGLSNGMADFSNGLIGGEQPLLADILAHGFQAYRYEHDTWLPIEENVRELVALIEKKIRSRRLLFIAFSRGGIVATRAAARLREHGRIVSGASDEALANGFFQDIQLMTFGSSHHGFRTSDVVSIIPRLGYCLQYLVSEATNGIPKALRRSIFLQSLRRLGRLPPGIAELSPANSEFREFIRSQNGQWVGQRLQTFGGAPVAPMWPKLIRAFLTWPVIGIGDGAVSLSSATAYGQNRREILGCRHGDYFQRAEVRQAIKVKLRQLCAN